MSHNGLISPNEFYWVISPEEFKKLQSPNEFYWVISPDEFKKVEFWKLFLGYCQFVKNINLFKKFKKL